MRNVETCTVIIRMEENFESQNRFDPETIVKNTWPMLVPWFTERHGVRSGAIQISDGQDDGHTVTFTWKYENEYEPPSQEEMDAASGMEARQGGNEVPSEGRQPDPKGDAQ